MRIGSIDLRELSSSQFCRHYGLRYADLDSLIFVLTGMRGQDFRMAYQLRLADDLLLYTDLPLNEVAERSGLGTRARSALPLATSKNLHIAIRRGFGCLAGERKKSRGPIGCETAYYSTDFMQTAI